MPRTAAHPRGFMLLAVALLVGTVLAGCSSQEPPATPTPTPTRPTSATSSASWTPTPVLRPNTPPTTASPTPTEVPPVPGAHPGAGGPIPATAEQATAQYDGVFVVRSPSGNVGCDLAPGVAGCGVLSLLESGSLGTDDAGHPLWWVSLESSPDADPAAPPPVISHVLQPLFVQHEAQLLTYGQVVHAGSYACASADVGMTCWNADTGHGVFMTREAMVTF